MRAQGVIAVAALVFASGLVAAGVRPAALTPSSPSGPPPIDYGSGEYLGSAACARCHETISASWKDSIHIQMTRPIAEAHVIGDFSPGTHLEKYGRAYRMSQRAGRYVIAVSHQGGSFEEFEVHYTLGVNRFQGYLSKRPDGRIYVLPVFWHRETNQWIDYKEITPLPVDTTHEFRQIWNVNCFNCHATNLRQNFDVETRTYDTSWTEMGIGCEACHGPGAAHVALMKAWEANPSAKPAYESSARNRELGALLRIFSPKSADKRQVFDACAYCHGNKTNHFVGMKPGDRYEDYAMPFLVSQPIPREDPQGDFWPDGRPNRFNRPQALMQSGCFSKGQATCTSCHTIHGAKHPHSLKVEEARTDLLCTQCHQQHIGPKLQAHTRHAVNSPGSRCVGCHMSNVNWRMQLRRLDHSFAPPVPEMTARYGVPDACTTCHDDKPPEWAARTMDVWYGDRERRDEVVGTADTMYAAGSGDPSAVAGLVRVATDRRKGAPLRASAAEFIGRIAERLPPGDLTVSALGPAANGLIGAAADPEPMVRITATHALGIVLERLGDTRRAGPLAARLVDPVRTVRAMAAGALLRLGVVTLDGAAGPALARAQDDYADMLQAFPDVAKNLTSLGWLEMSRGRLPDARQALDHALALNPLDAEPHMLLGVVFARQDRLGDAIKEWRAAQKLSPKDPRPERLIAEAERRLKD